MLVCCYRNKASGLSHFVRYPALAHRYAHSYHGSHDDGDSVDENDEDVGVLLPQQGLRAQPFVGYPALAHRYAQSYHASQDDDSVDGNDEDRQP